jgi:hypothetical protein
MQLPKSIDTGQRVQHKELLVGNLKRHKEDG